MSASFSALSGQRDGIQDHCLMNSRLTSLDYSNFPTSMMYMNPASIDAPAFHPEFFSASSLPGLDHVDGKSTDGKEEMVSFSPQSTDRQLDFALSFSDYGNIVNLDAQLFTKEVLHLQSNNDQNLQPEGFSLSLGNQVPSSADMASYENRYVNSGVSSLLSPHVEPAFDRHCQSSDLKTANLFPFDSSASHRNLDVGSLCNQTSVLPKENPHRIFKGEMTVDEMNSSSKYLKAVKELLNELVHVDKYQKPQSGLSLNHQNPTTESPDELSPAIRNDMHNKMAELFSLLNEVDRKYKLYCQQMQCVASSFEIMAGGGAATCYTAVALQTISRQFRRLRDAIRQQIQVTRKRLGEKNPGVGLARLKYVDQKAREERSLQQFGVIRQPWRPQRGLPESAVSILRAWLFEHFLHPYPKDSEKIMLARQAGLTRSQVANWFINARVRLWKPMIEEMYKDEFGMEMDFKSSPESPPAAKKIKSESEDTTEELFKSFTATVADCSHLRKPNESRNNISAALESNDYASNLRYQGRYHELENITSPSNASWKNEIISITNQHNMTNNQDIITSDVDAYHLPELGGAVRDRVSLPLGLQHSLNNTLPMFSITASGVDNTTIASAGLERQDYFCIDPISQQDRFLNPNLLSHFVV